ncbi:hypothetical protein ACXX61_001669 [Escherichia coli]|nr:hypothetical protein [Escherichia coli]EKB7872859.1 hypothetical protein [Escherichia coli]
MNDREFRAMLQASRQRNRHNSYAYTNSPTSHELPSDKYCALLAVMCAKLIGIVEHHIAVGNIESMENEQPDFEFDPYLVTEEF